LTIRIIEKPSHDAATASSARKGLRARAAPRRHGGRIG